MSNKILGQLAEMASEIRGLKAGRPGVSGTRAVSQVVKEAAVADSIELQLKTVGNREQYRFCTVLEKILAQAKLVVVEENFIDEEAGRSAVEL